MPFNRLGAKALFAGHNPANEASGRVLRKLGFLYIHDEYFAPMAMDHLAYLMTAEECSNTQYEECLATALRPLCDGAIRRVAFGDLFLADVRAYRERQMAELGLAPVFPIWGLETAELAREFLRLGFQAILVCVDTEALDSAFAGRSFDEDLLRDLPPGIDPCGENGEFHTFVHAGPIFQRPIDIELGELEVRGRFAFRDLLEAA